MFIDERHDSKSIKWWIFMFPILYLIHDIEEILTVENFLIEHAHLIPFQITTLEFTFAFILLWLVTSIGCYKAFIGKNFLGMNPRNFFSFLVPGILLANGIGHLIQFFLIMDYVPGLYTSIFVIFPYSLLTVKHLLRRKLLTSRKCLFFLFAGFVIQVPFALTAHYISNKLTKYFLGFFS